MIGKKKPEPQQEFVWRDFREKSYDELEKEVDEAYRKEVRARNIKIAIVAAILIFLFHDVAGFWVRFGLPRIPVKTEQAIDLSAGPIVDDLEDDEDSLIKYVTLEDKEPVDLMKKRAMTISGRVVARNYLFWGNYLPGGKRTIQSTAMFDLGLVWGKLSDKDVLKNYAFYCSKDTQSRSLYPTLKLGVKYPPLPWPYVRTHLMHLSIVPANPRVMSGLIYAFKNQSVKLEGYVVNVKLENGRWVNTVSTGRVTPNSNSGDSKILYVKSVQVGKRIYK